MTVREKIKLFDKKLILKALMDCFLKLNPVMLIKNPVIFLVAVGSFFTTIIVFDDILTSNFSLFNFQICLWLWFTVLFANFSEAIAEGKGKAQAESLRKSRTMTQARKIVGNDEIQGIVDEEFSIFHVRLALLFCFDRDC